MLACIVQRIQRLNAMVVLILILTVPKTVLPWLPNLLTERLITPMSKQQRQTVVLLPEKLTLRTRMILVITTVLLPRQVIIGL